MSGSPEQDKPDFYLIDVEDMHIQELVDALNVWRSKCPSDHVPVWGDLDFLDFAPHILPRMIVLDVDHEPGFGTYRYWGTRVASFNAMDMTGKRVSKLAPLRHANYSERQYRWIVENKKPALFVACLGEKPWNKKYEAVLRLPCCSTPNGPIDRIVTFGFYDDVQQTIRDFVDIEIDMENNLAIDN